LDCNFDGGDCCGCNVKTDYCTECECLDEDYTTEETPCPGICTFEHSYYIGDGYCDDGANNLDCNFDGGDCCGPNVITNYCAECECLDEDYTTKETTTTTTTTTKATPCFGNCTFENCHWIGDGICDDGANNLDCNFDGGDCCGPNVITNFCAECECLDEDYTTKETTTTTTTTTKPSPCFGNCTFGACGWIGDGYCDDGANNLDCNFDGGDCCGPNVNTDYCTACECLDPDVGTEFSCKNLKPTKKCKKWKNQGKCNKNWAKEKCAKTCGEC